MELHSFICADILNNNLVTLKIELKWNLFLLLVCYYFLGM